MNGEVNHENGNFSTNYLEFAAYVTGLSGIWFGWSALSLEVHPSFSQNQELNGRYGQWRLHTATRLLANLPLKGEVSVQLSAILDTFMKTSQTAWVRELERFPISVRYTITIPGIDLGLYVGYYFGHDYYNIYFDRVINVLQIGIVGSVSPSLVPDD
jgi:hypothetical protein